MKPNRDEFLDPFLNPAMVEDRGALARLFAPALFREPGTLLYVGGSPQRFELGQALSDAGNEITLLEIFPAYAQAMQGCAYVEYVVLGDVRQIDELELPHAVFDYTVWWHGPEHIEAEFLEPTAAGLERRTRKLVVMASPWGRWDWPPEDGNPHMAHRSYVYPADYEAMGYRYVAIWPEDRAGGHLMAWKRCTP